MRAIRSQLLERSSTASRPRFRLGLAGLFAVLQSGCAIRYHDARTGTEHIWGLAHVKMRVAPVAGASAPSATASPAAAPASPSAASPVAVATQTEILGLGLHFGGGASAAAPATGDSGLSLGWDRRTRILVPDDTALSFDWPSANLFDVRIGSTPPALSTHSGAPTSPAATPSAAASPVFP